MTEDEAAKDPNEGDDYLECQVCGKTRKCTESDLRTYAATGWPYCCGQKMIYVRWIPTASASESNNQS
jgi:hypothetical protein